MEFYCICKTCPRLNKSNTKKWNPRILRSRGSEATCYETYVNVTTSKLRAEAKI